VFAGTLAVQPADAAGQQAALVAALVDAALTRLVAAINTALAPPPSGAHVSLSISLVDPGRGFAPDDGPVAAAYLTEDIAPGPAAGAEATARMVEAAAARVAAAAACGPGGAIAASPIALASLDSLLANYVTEHLARVRLAAADAVIHMGALDGVFDLEAVTSSSSTGDDDLGAAAALGGAAAAALAAGGTGGSLMLAGRTFYGPLSAAQATAGGSTAAASAAAGAAVSSVQRELRSALAADSRLTGVLERPPVGLFPSLEEGSRYARTASRAFARATLVPTLRRAAASVSEPSATQLAALDAFNDALIAAMPPPPPPPVHGGGGVAAELASLLAAASPRTSRAQHASALAAAGTCFVVRHAAGDVLYDVGAFLAQNRAPVWGDAQLRRLAGGAPAIAAALPPPTASAGAITRIARVEAAVAALDATVGSPPSGPPAAGASAAAPRAGVSSRATSFWVQCLAPNALRLPGVFDANAVLAQLRGWSVLPLAAVAKYGYSVSLPLADWYERYVMLLPHGSGGRDVAAATDALLRTEVPRHEAVLAPFAGGATVSLPAIWPFQRYTPTERRYLASHNSAGTPLPPVASESSIAVERALVRRLLAGLRTALPPDALPSDTDVVVGSTRVFMRVAAAAGLDSAREHAMAEMDAAATLLAACMRAWTLSRQYNALRTAYIRLQARFRARRVRGASRVVIGAVYAVKYAVQAWLARRHYTRLRAAVVTLQARFLRWRVSSAWSARRATLRRLHAAVLGRLLRREYAAKLAAAAVIQRLGRAFVARNRDYWSRIYAALMLQAAWRGYSTRARRAGEVAVLRKRVTARLVNMRLARLQAGWRRRRAVAVFSRLRAAAVGVQSWLRGRLLYRGYRVWRAAAPVIQAAWRRDAARLTFRRAREAAQGGAEARRQGGGAARGQTRWEEGAAHGLRPRAARHCRTGVRPAAVHGGGGPGG